ncbi:type II toxin-antitoxin system RelE/ParE family toxin [Methylobacterium planeticum]|uniref:Plasmid maintenance system killer protein n=1 Tax=Methylobacterium planeticum TaxID=2615211 RepID=A0A6N6MMW6_9HYPH|nr:type II toxin-antitoxin system RelE/ParE family toxin [Methylobacterium planeticum]KAB1072136.1 hypothetical protein F6X51_17055 [Methylobacterium planeticum]
MIARVRSKARKRFWTRSDAAGLRANWVDRIERQLTLLEQAQVPEDMNVPGYGFHALAGGMAGRDAVAVAVAVSRNWRLTFGFEGQDAIDVDLEDYHGR